MACQGSPLPPRRAPSPRSASVPSALTRCFHTRSAGAGTATLTWTPASGSTGLGVIGKRVDLTAHGDPPFRRAARGGRAPRGQSTKRRAWWQQAKTQAARPSDPEPETAAAPHRTRSATRRRRARTPSAAPRHRPRGRCETPRHLDRLRPAPGELDEGTAGVLLRPGDGARREQVTRSGGGTVHGEVRQHLGRRPVQP